MALNLGEWCVVLDSANADELSEFYEKLLGWKRYKGEEWTLLVKEGQKGPWITFQQTEDYVPPVWPAEEGKQQQMTHLDFHVENVEEGVKHALSCGATLSEIQLEDDWRVMMDPAGHPFCILPIPDWMTAEH